MKAQRKKILIINIYGIGDVLFTTPVVRNIRENLPEAFIGYICNRRAFEVLEHNPHINKIFIYERDDFAALWQKSRVQAAKKVREMLAAIRKEEFDTVIDLSANRLFSFLGLWLGIPERVGFDYKGRSPFLNRRVIVREGYVDKPVVEYYLGLLEFMGLRVPHKRLEVFPTVEEKDWAKRILSQSGIGPENILIGLVPGGGGSWGREAPFKRWPTQNFAQLADKIVEKYAVKIILLGDSSEKELADDMVRQVSHPVVNLVGQTTVGQYLSLLSRCRWTIVNDGGPLHMAVASGTKTISIFGAVDENVYGPYPKGDHIVVTKKIACRPCYRHFRRADCRHISCLGTITVDEVFGKVEEILRQ